VPVVFDPNTRALTKIDDPESGDNDRTSGSSPIIDDNSDDVSQLGKRDKDLGGIDFNPNNLDLQTQGTGIQFRFIPTELEHMPINGFTPVIFQMTPMTNFRLLIRETQEQSDEFSISRLN